MVGILVVCINFDVGFEESWCNAATLGPAMCETGLKLTVSGKFLLLKNVRNTTTAAMTTDTIMIQ